MVPVVIQIGQNKLRQECTYDNRQTVWTQCTTTLDVVLGISYTRRIHDIDRFLTWGVLALFRKTHRTSVLCSAVFVSRCPLRRGYADVAAALFSLISELVEFILQSNTIVVFSRRQKFHTAILSLNGDVFEV